MPFISPEGDLEKIFIDDYAIIDQHAMPGTLWSWGQNDEGQLGDNTVVYKSSPVQTITGGTNWKQVAGSSGVTAAIKTDGTLWTWGPNSSGQLGTNDVISRSSPVQTIAGGTNWKQVSCGGSYVAAIKTDGTLWTWGWNYDGRLGTNDIIDRSSPVQTIAGGANWKQVACGYRHSGAIKTDGTLWMWGSQTIDGSLHGVLGTNDTISRSSPVQTIAGGANWKQVACGYNHSGAIKTDGTLWMWGRGPFGGVGDNTNIDRSSPVQTIAGGTNWKQLSVGQNVSYAIKTDGTLWMWGYESATGGYHNIPVQLFYGTEWKEVSVSLRGHNVATKTDGTLWTWGQNAYGQLGDNTTTTKSSPVQTIAAGTNWKHCCAGAYSSYAIRF